MNKLKSIIFGFITLLIPVIAFAGSPLDDQHVIRYVIKYDEGGNYNDYKNAFKYFSDNKMSLAIDGFCMSGCTLILNKDYKFDLCITDNTVIKLHKPFYMKGGFYILSDVNRIYESLKTWDQEFYGKFPDWLQEEIDKRGYIPSVYDGAKPSDTMDLDYSILSKYMDTCDIR